MVFLTVVVDLVTEVARLVDEPARTRVVRCDCTCTWTCCALARFDVRMTRAGGRERLGAMIVGCREVLLTVERRLRDRCG